MKMSIKTISIKSLAAEGAAEIMPEEKRIYIKADKECGVSTPLFDSFIEKVQISFHGESMPDSIIRYTLYSYDDDGKENMVYTTSVKGNFGVDYCFDPVSLAVYQNAVSFKFSLCAVTDTAEFYLDKFVIIEGDDGAKADDESELQINNIVTLENDKRGVSVLQKNGEKLVVPIVPKKVLFVGNSILLGMFNTYGMCATSPEKDYAYYVQQEILKLNPDCEFYKLHGGGFEHSESAEAFESWFYHIENKYTNKPAVESFTEDLDLILIQLADNVNTEAKIANFKVNSELLLESIKERSPKARILWIYGWYNKYNSVEKLMELSKRWQMEIVDISGLRSKENESYTGQLSKDVEGQSVVVKDAWVTHPGDKGMKEIGKKIVQALMLDACDGGYNNEFF